MSWKALDWATDIRVGSPTMRLILILLANKADEKFSCYPSVGTLVTESCAARSTVLETLKRLEVEGFITRVAQYRESGAQRSSRYLLNHPDARHLKRGPGSGPPGPQVGQGGSDPWTGGVQDLDPRGSRIRTLDPPEEPPSEPSLTILLQSMPEPWRLSGEEAMELSPAVEYALVSGWTSRTLMTESCAARSTVLETLKRLEAEGFITRVAPISRIRGPAIHSLPSQPSRRASP